MLPLPILTDYLPNPPTELCKTIESSIDGLFLILNKLLFNLFIFLSDYLLG